MAASRGGSVGGVKDVSVRAAGPSDISGLVVSTAALFAEDGAERDRLRDQSWPAHHGEQWCTDLLHDHDALVMVAIADGGVVGHLIGLHLEGSDMWVAPRAELVSMHVHGPHRSLGVGGRLVEAFGHWARGRGAARLQVTAYTANERAVQFYLRQGFTSLSVELASDP